MGLNEECLKRRQASTDDHEWSAELVLQLFVCVLRKCFETVELELDAHLELRQLASAASLSPKKKKKAFSRRLCGALGKKVTEAGAPAQAEANQYGWLRETRPAP